MLGDCSKLEGMRAFIEEALKGQHAGNALPVRDH
jgi:hypothetical protein